MSGANRARLLDWIETIVVDEDPRGLGKVSRTILVTN